MESIEADSAAEGEAESLTVSVTLVRGEGLKRVDSRLRGGKAAEHLCDAGFEAYNGGGPAHIAAARVYEMTESGELPPYTPPMP